MQGSTCIERWLPSHPFGIAIRCDELDPFNRFAFIPIVAKDDILKQWISCSNEAFAQIHILEAAMINAAVSKKQSCLHCSKHSLKFNTNVASSFSNVYCDTCGSVYAIWGMKDQHGIEKGLAKGRTTKIGLMETIAKRSSAFPDGSKYWRSTFGWSKDI